MEEKKAASFLNRLDPVSQALNAAGVSDGIIVEFMTKDGWSYDARSRIFAKDAGMLNAENGSPRIFRVTIELVRHFFYRAIMGTVKEQYKWVRHAILCAVHDRPDEVDRRDRYAKECSEKYGLTLARRRVTEKHTEG